MLNYDEKRIPDYGSSDEKTNRQSLVQHLKDTPIPDKELLGQLGLFLDSKSLSRILFMDHIYQQIRDVQGVVMEFGNWYGQSLALFTALRGIYEPFNRHRKIVGFDTFAGFPEIGAEDGDSKMMVKGNLAVPENYEDVLTQILDTQESLNPLNHLRKFELRKGDCTVELPKYLEENPQTIVALVYFDLDLYEPTKKCLEMLRPRLTKGSVLGFDELNDPDSPGETLALMEAFGLENIRLKRFPYASRVSYFVVE